METVRDVDREATSMKVLGVDLSPSVSIKDRTIVGASEIKRMPIT